MKKKVSFRKKALQIMLVVIVPVIVCLIACSVYIINSILYTNIRENYTTRLSVVGQSVELRLSAVESYMTSFVAAGTDFNVLSFRTAETKLFESTQRILERYNYIMYTDPQISGFLISSPVNDYYRIIESHNAGYIAAPPLRSYLEEGMAAGVLNLSRWYLDEIDGTTYLLRVMGFNGAYQMCFIRADQFLQDLSRSLETDEQLTFASPDHADSGYRTLREGGLTRILLTYNSNKLFAPLQLSAPYSIAVQPAQWGIIVLALSVLLALVPFGVSIFHRVLLRPMEDLGQTLEQVRAGNLDARSSYSGQVAEYEQLGETFNSMMDEIRSLKIRQYEQALRVQKTELQYLHLQIRPHFYLNCLKIVYSLAECRDYESIQKLILLLSDYLRGIWNNSSTITVAQEAHHVATFVALNNLCSVKEVLYEEKIDPAASELQLPPLLMLTFVENAIKHGQILDRQLHVSLRVSLIGEDDERYMNITISDNGPGFTPEQLEALNHPAEENTDTHGQFGIFNVRERLQLVYGGRASITFIRAAGASIEVFIPCAEEKEAQA